MWLHACKDKIVLTGDTCEYYRRTNSNHNALTSSDFFERVKGVPMEKQVETRIDTANWGVIPRVLLLVALLLSMLGLSATPTTQAASRIQPALLDMVASQPDAKVSVIVQKLAKDNSVEAQVTNLGGIVTKDLSIINAFVAVMTARTAPAVAQLNSVRWVSLDSPVANTGGGGCDAISTSNLVNAY